MSAAIPPHHRGVQGGALESIVIGLVGIIVGTLVAGFGARVFFLLLPLWAFVAGFVIGGDVVASVLGDRFLATAAGWIAGLGLGVVLAVLAGLWFWAAVLVLAASVGWTLGAGIAAALGFEPGLVTLAAGVAGVVLLGGLAIAVNAPTLLVAVLTSFGGAAWAVAGALVMLGRIGLADLESGAVAALYGYPLAIGAWLVLAIVALGSQLLDARDRSVALLVRPDRSIS
jgi:hypothetical protein